MSEGAEAGTAEEGAPAAEAVEIPKQQSAEAAADSETGEGART
ncbi:gliding motility protein [Streptomyces goshikiensis]|nr:gliding motility protein [Streptomyces goshikiensis]WBY22463.1 gliding motility protein [Streptomyces goshikiensis]